MPDTGPSRSISARKIQDGRALGREIGALVFTERADRISIEAGLDLTCWVQATSHPFSWEHDIMIIDSLGPRRLTNLLRRGIIPWCARLASLLASGLASAQAMPGEVEGVPLARTAIVEDLTEWIEQLGSPIYAERESATRRLIEMGPSIRTALLETLEGGEPNLEIQDRIILVLDEIERRRLLASRLVDLAYRDQPLDEILQDLEAQSGVGLILEDSTNRQDEASPVKISLQADRRVSLWEAIDLLSEEADLRINASLQRFGGSSEEPTIRLRPGGYLDQPRCYSGPFRLAMTQMLYQQSRNFTRKPDGDFPPSLETFYCQVEVRCLPGLNFAQSGPVEIIQAIDERGESLDPADHDGPGRGSPYSSQMRSASTVRITLHRPDRAGDRLKRFEARIPVTLSARRLSDPLELALDSQPDDPQQDEDQAETESGGEATLKLIDFDPQGNGGPTIQILIRYRDPAVNANQRYQEIFQNLDLLDEQGRLVPWSRLGGTSIRNQEVRLMLRARQTNNPDEFGPPVRIRYYGSVQASYEIRVDFRDLPLPWAR